MATNWPTLSRNMDNTSTINRNPKVETLEFGDAAVQRYPVGINNLPGVFNITYANMSQSDFATLRNFIQLHASLSDTLRIPLLPEYRDGSVFGYFRITGFSISGDYAPTINVTAEETFNDA